MRICLLNTMLLLFVNPAFHFRNICKIRKHISVKAFGTLIHAIISILLNFAFESEPIRANLHGNKRILKWWPFWNKVYNLNIWSCSSISIFKGLLKTWLFKQSISWSCLVIAIELVLDFMICDTIPTFWKTQLDTEEPSYGTMYAPITQEIISRHSFALLRKTLMSKISILMPSQFSHSLDFITILNVFESLLQTVYYFLVICMRQFLNSSTLYFNYLI